MWQVAGCSQLPMLGPTTDARPSTTPRLLGQCSWRHHPAPRQGDDRGAGAVPVRPQARARPGHLRPRRLLRSWRRRPHDIALPKVRGGHLRVTAGAACSALEVRRRSVASGRRTISCGSRIHRHSDDSQRTMDGDIQRPFHVVPDAFHERSGAGLEGAVVSTGDDGGAGSGVI